MAEPRMGRKEIEARLESEWRSLVDSMSAATGSPLELPPDRRIALSRVALFAQLEEVREHWKEIRALIDEQVSSRFVNAAWTLKDLLAHLASWSREFRQEVETASRGGGFEYTIPFAMSVFGPNQWNEREVAARRGRDLAAIFREFEEETVRLQEIVLAMEQPDLHRVAEFPLSPGGDPASRWRGPVALIVAGKCLHDRHHLAQIRERISRLLE